MNGQEGLGKVVSVSLVRTYHTQSSIVSPSELTRVSGTASPYLSGVGPATRLVTEEKIQHFTQRVFRRIPTEAFIKKGMLLGGNAFEFTLVHH